MFLNKFACQIRQLSTSFPRFIDHRVNSIDKRCLVWTKKYKSIDEVPAMVSTDVVERARNRVRIRLANIMMALTLVGCLFMAFSGKRGRERGESVHQMNIDFHKNYRMEQEKLEKEKNK